MNLSFWGNLGLFSGGPLLLALGRIPLLKPRCCTGKRRNGLEEYFSFLGMAKIALFVRLLLSGSVCSIQ